MIISKCPLRVSLVGGSTDLQQYLDQFNTGRVISFTSNLHTYIALKPSDRYYRIIYSSMDICVDVDDIKNDIAREVIKYFNLPPIEVVFTSDIPSTGSGLASSSSYLIAMINAALHYTQQSRTLEELGCIAMEIERSFNPLTGYQDIYGCIVPGLKQLIFNQEGLSDVINYNNNLFDEYDLYLIPTDITRSSTNVLSTLDIDKINKLIPSVLQMHEALCSQDYPQVIALINEGWSLKKQTSPTMLSHKMKCIDSKLQSNKSILAHRLIGAGAGGYFLAVLHKGQKPDVKKMCSN